MRTSLPTGQRLDIVMWSDDRAVGMRGWYSYGPVGISPANYLPPPVLLCQPSDIGDRSAFR